MNVVKAYDKYKKAKLKMRRDLNILVSPIQSGSWKMR